MSKINVLYGIIFLLASCSASKRFYNDGKKFEDAYMYEQASDYYYKALEVDTSNIDANIGLNRVGVKIINKKLEKFEKAYIYENYKIAVDEYLEAKQVEDRLNSAGVLVEIPAESRYHFELAKKKYIASKIDEVNNLLKSGKFIEAKSVLINISKLDKSNQDIVDLQGVSIAEPIFRKAIEEYDKGNYRKAYYLFDKVLNYKNARAMKELSKEKTTFTILIKPFVNASKYYDIDEKLTLQVEEFLRENKNPFLDIIYSDNYKRLLSEKLLSRDSVWKNHADNLMNADAILEVSISNVVFQKGKLREERIRGWEKYNVKRRKPNSNDYYSTTEFRKIYYYEYSKRKYMEIEININITSFATNKILSQKTINSKKQDEILYIDFDGENNNLRSGYWEARNNKSNNDFINISSKQINVLRNKINGRRTIQSDYSMEAELIKKISRDIVITIDKYDVSSHK